MGCVAIGRFGPKNMLRRFLFLGAILLLASMAGADPCGQACTADYWRTLAPAAAAAAIRQIDLEARDGVDNTPLHHAACEAAPEVLRHLVEAGADVNARNRFGWTPLMIAAGHGQSDQVRALVDAGAGIGLTSNMGETALHFASQHGQSDTFYCCWHLGPTPRYAPRRANPRLTLPVPIRTFCFPQPTRLCAKEWSSPGRGAAYPFHSSQLQGRKWRRDRDSNPGWACTHNGFRDRPVRPLRHLSAGV